MPDKNRYVINVVLMAEAAVLAGGLIVASGNQWGWALIFVSLITAKTKE